MCFAQVNPLKFFEPPFSSSRYSTNIAPQHYSRPQHPPPPPPPPSSSSSTSSSHQPPPPSFLPMHGFLPPMSPSASSSPSSSPYHMSRQHQDGSSYINNDNDNRYGLQVSNLSCSYFPPSVVPAASHMIKCISVTNSCFMLDYHR